METNSSLVAPSRRRAREIAALNECVASGQLSAQQIEAHRIAGDFEPFTTYQAVMQQTPNNTCVEIQITVAQYGRCSGTLRNLGKPYPRTCAECGLGPCKTKPAQPEQPAIKYTYASTQETNCAGCGILKHTPLRVDKMEGYVCLTCIDKKLESLLDAAIAQPEQPTLEAALRSALQAMLTHMGMDEDEWNKPTFDQARAALAQPVQPATPVAHAEPVATVIEELDHDGQGWCSKVRWLYNPVPLGEILFWEQSK